MATAMTGRGMRNAVDTFTNLLLTLHDINFFYYYVSLLNNCFQVSLLLGIFPGCYTQGEYIDISRVS